MNNLPQWHYSPESFWRSQSFLLFISIEDEVPTKWDVVGAYMPDGTLYLRQENTGETMRLQLDVANKWFSNQEKQLFILPGLKITEGKVSGYLKPNWEDLKAHLSNILNVGFFILAE